MASSSLAPRSWRYDVFPSFSGQDVRKSFLSHLMEKLKAKSIKTFKDHGIERSRPIAPELFLAIRESMIAIVIFSKSYASSTWCLNELVEIHKCYEDLKQMVIPVFYDVDPSHVRKQTGEFGKFFEETCKGKTEDVKQRWVRVLTEVANLAGEDSRNWSDEASLIAKITKDVWNKVIITPTNCFGDFVGIESHIEAVKSKLCMESEEAIMVGIQGPSGIGKTTIARALYSQLYNKFDYRTFFVAHERTNRDSYGMKLCWEEQLLSEILDEKDMKISHLGAVKQRLNHKKVFIVLDDVDDLELLKTLVGQAGWFGPGSRIIVITQNRQLLKSHKIDRVYEVGFPSREVALQMLCRSAFGQNSPPHGFMKLATEVTELSGYLPLGLDIMGSSLAGRDMEEWMEMMPRLRNSLDGRIENTLRVGYNGLDVRDQEIFLYIACLLNGHKVKYIRNFLGDSVNFGLKLLAEKSLIRISPQGKTVEMHSLLQMLGKEIVRAESIHSPGKRRFLMDAEDIRDVLTDNTGTDTVLGISLNTSEVNEPLFIDENSFKGMHNLRYLKFYKKWSQQSGEGRLYLPQDLDSLPRKLKILYWDECPLKCMPYNFKAEYLVEFSMNDSKLEKLWQGTQRLPSLKKMTLRLSTKLKEIPDPSYAINLEKLDLFRCTSLVTLPSSIRNLDKLKVLKMSRCSNLEVLPTDVNLESLDYLDFRGCSRLRDFPKFSRNISLLYLDGTAIEEEDSVWIENMTMFTNLDWKFCPLRHMPSNFHPEHLVHLSMIGSKLEKLWEGVQSLGNLLEMDLSSSENLKEFPNLSKATNLEKLHLNHCKSLVMVPSSIGSLSKLCELNMEGCTGLESLPTNINLESLSTLDLSGCSQLRDFPQISTSIYLLYLDNTAIEDVPSWIENFSELTKLTMSGCKKLKNISPNICKLKYLKLVNFSGCEGVTEIGDASVVVTRMSRTIDDWLVKSEKAFILLKLLLLIVVKLLTLCAKILKSLQGVSHSFYNPYARLKFHNCLSLDGYARKLIIQSDFEYAVLPGGEVPKCFMNRAYGSSLTIPLRESSLFDKFLGFKVCIVFEPPTEPEANLSCIEVRWRFRGKNGVHRFHFDMYSTKMDHLLMFHFGFLTEEVTECPSELDCDDVKFELYYRMYDCFCNRYNPESHTETCPCSVQTIKGCGIEFWDVPPPLNDDRIISETELNMSCCSSFSYEGEFLENHLIEDDLTFTSCLDEGEYSENLPSDSVSTLEAIAQWLFEFDGELNATYHC